MIHFTYKSKMHKSVKNAGIKIFPLVTDFVILLVFSCIMSCGDSRAGKAGTGTSEKTDTVTAGEISGEYPPVNALLVLPGNPVPGEAFRILATGGENIRKAKIIVSGPSGI